MYVICVIFPFGLSAAINWRFGILVLVIDKFCLYNFLTDPKSESRLKLVNILNPLNPFEALDVYVPRDERFGHLKMSDFLAYAIKSLSQSIKPALEHYFDQTRNEFDNFQEVLDLYEGGFKLPTAVLDTIRQNIPFEMLKELFRSDGEQFLKFPVPHVIKGIVHICVVHPILFSR